MPLLAVLASASDVGERVHAAQLLHPHRAGRGEVGGQRDGETAVPVEQRARWEGRVLVPAEEQGHLGAVLALEEGLLGHVVVGVVAGNRGVEHRLAGDARSWGEKRCRVGEAEAENRAGVHERLEGEEDFRGVAPGARARRAAGGGQSDFREARGRVGGVVDAHRGYDVGEVAQDEHWAGALQPRVAGDAGGLQHLAAPSRALRHRHFGVETGGKPRDVVGVRSGQRQRDDPAPRSVQVGLEPEEGALVGKVLELPPEVVH
mmetsp:Transcript_4103/g.17202  ORF Transcript_4103/g.17202 Transcript_4103/m.17202 type:complete len:261 (-) Transcript_4103:1154-1936(-)